MIRWLYFLMPALAAALCARVALGYFQLESYQLGGYFRSLKRNWLRAFLPGLVVMVIGMAAVTLLGRVAFTDGTQALGLSAMLLVAIIEYAVQRKLPAKKPLVVTARVKRLCGFYLVVSLGASAGLVFGAKVLTLSLFLPMLAPLLLALAALLALPFEKAVQRAYLVDAMHRLDAADGLIKIGITGSYGKTSAKFLLETLLSERYRVLATPGSFNTSMGVTRVIREQLAPDHRVFIAEMGARHRGDIRLLCKLVRPRYGILTSVGPQHLETFHTQETICREKFELARAIPPDGAMVFAADGGLNDQLYEKATCPKHLSGEGAQGLGLRAEDIEVGPWGSRFTMTDGQESIRVETRLLGAHNIGNLLAAATMARVLGLDLPTIARGAAKAKPVEHRLQLLTASGGVTIIDDAFNANPVGAAAALAVLKGFPGRRIIVTPGFVEMGREEAAYNRAFGEQMADSVDMAILVGRRHTAPIAEGLKSQGFAAEKLHIVTSLAEATALLNPQLRPGDTVLYENDLPDNYQE
ncbi:MAG: UDP-N-acetylmuramoyl-tripeptide--D-alanyl-D-alanine ligase [Oscillospiraceae bacterium]|jgi:UDP-N-acetylmuramoyl-tripeptide--D-alanyl-D-alanine ligase|nr:UDP-N-acetylmuramoyl-tripeptide--D-alanyl-D-alanine ligase [Oscillospiraceae bacterium]